MAKSMQELSPTQGIQDHSLKVEPVAEELTVVTELIWIKLKINKL